MGVIQKTEKKLILSTGNDLSYRVAEKIKSIVEKKKVNTLIFNGSSNYAHFAKIAKEDPDYAVTLSIGSSNKPEVTVLPYRVEHCTGNPRRDTTESQIASKKVTQALQMIDRFPTSRSGSVELQYDIIRDFEWFVKSKNPFIDLRATCSEDGEDELAEAIANGVLNYWRR